MANAPADISQDTHVKNEMIPPHDRQVLRALAGRVAELAARDIEHQKKQLWTDHNDLRGKTRPPIGNDPGRVSKWVQIARQEIDKAF